LPSAKTIAGHARTSTAVPNTEALPTAPSSGLRHRPLLDVDDLDIRPEWDRGRDALMAFIAESNLPGTAPDQNGRRPAQWLHAEMLISVELVYGTPVIALEGGCGRTSIPLAHAQIEDLRSECRSITTLPLAQKTGFGTTSG
jgi:hypothetical protein